MTTKALASTSLPEPGAIPQIDRSPLLTASIAPLREGLSIEEFNRVDSIAGLRALYREQGIEFANEEELIKTISRDWCRERERLYLEALKNPAEPELISVEVSAGGTQYELFPLYHVWHAGQAYYQKIIDRISGGERVWSEQNIANWYLRHTAQELPDHLVETLEIKPSDKFIEGLKFGLKLPVTIIKEQFAIFRDASSEPKSEAQRRLDQIAVNAGPDFFLKTLHVPAPALADPDFPAYVEIELQERSGHYGPTQARSAYMAEFLRAWPNQNEKRMVVGGAHAPEIEYFLRHGVKDQRLIDLAREHVALFVNGGPALNELTERAGHFSLTKRIHPLHEFAGTALGLAPYLSGLAGAFFFLA